MHRESPGRRACRSRPTRRRTAAEIGESLFGLWPKSGQSVLFQRRVLLRVCFFVQARRNKDFWRGFLSGHILGDGLNGHLADLFGILDRLGVYLSRLDVLLRFQLSVGADDFY